jgi:hypothetical protein
MQGICIDATEIEERIEMQIGRGRNTKRNDKREAHLISHFRQ